MTFTERLVQYDTAKEMADWLHENGLLQTLETSEQLAYDFAIRFASRQNLAAFEALKKIGVL